MAAKKKKTKPTRLTAATSRLIRDALRAGNYLETAASLADVGRSTIFAWIKNGRADLDDGKRSTLHARFVIDVDNAIADAERAMLNEITAHRINDWRSTAWRLERRHPDRWGPKQRLEHTGVDGGPIELDISGASERLAAKLGDIEKRKATRKKGQT